MIPPSSFPPATLCTVPLLSQIHDFLNCYYVYILIYIYWNWFSTWLYLRIHSENLLKDKCWAASQTSWLRISELSGSTSARQRTSHCRLAARMRCCWRWEGSQCEPLLWVPSEQPSFSSEDQTPQRKMIAKLRTSLWDIHFHDKDRNSSKYSLKSNYKFKAPISILC